MNMDTRGMKDSAGSAQFRGIAEASDKGFLEGAGAMSGFKNSFSGSGSGSDSKQ